jgi:transmembrane protein EpsG
MIALVSKYLLFFFSVLFLSRIKNNKLILNQKLRYDFEHTKLTYSLFLILILVFFFYGWRHIDGGSDYRNYVETYNLIVTDSSLLNQYYRIYEIGFKYLVYISSSLNIPSQVFFGFIGAFTWYLLFRGSYKYKYLLSIVIFAVLVNGFFYFSQSAIRQSIAIGFFFISIQYIVEKNFFKYFRMLLIASLFHTSAILLLPLYFLRSFGFNRTIASIIIILSMTSIPTEVIYSSIITISEILGSGVQAISVYMHYLESEKILSNDNAVGTGLGVIFKTLVTFWIIFMSRKVLNIHKELKIYFLIYILGYSLYLMFYDIELIARFLQYLNISFIMVFASIVFYSRKRYEKLVSYSICIVYGFLFVVSTINWYDKYIGG